MVAGRRRRRERRGAPWTEAEDERLLAVSRLPPRTIADIMGAELACMQASLGILAVSGRASREALSRPQGKKGRGNPLFFDPMRTVDARADRDGTLWPRRYATCTTREPVAYRVDDILG
jgi:hypothetical protein